MASIHARCLVQAKFQVTSAVSKTYAEPDGDDTTSDLFCGQERNLMHVVFWWNAFEQENIVLHVDSSESIYSMDLSVSSRG